MVDTGLLTEAVNCDSALAVVLNDLVTGGLGTSALDHGIAIALDGESVLAYVDPPDVPVNVLALCSLYLANTGTRTQWCKNPRSEHPQSGPCQ
jgi:hypothetical protein